MANDTDEEGDDLKAFKFIDPLYGIATISEDGKIEYIHDDSETTLDSLRYIVKDSICGDTATVYITINPVPDCPIVEDDVYYVTEGDTLTVDSCFTQVLNPGSNNENWALNEPNSSGDENIGEIYSDGTWNDEKETILNQPYLMEVNSLITSKSGYKYIGQYDGHSYFTSNVPFLWYDAKACLLYTSDAADD